MNLFDAIFYLINKLLGLFAHIPIPAVAAALGAVLTFVITQWNKIKEFVNDVNQYRENRYLDKKINRPLARSIEKVRKEPILCGSYERIFLPKLVVDRGRKEIEIDLNPGGIIIGIMPSKSMENVVETLNRHISQNLSDYCVVHDQVKLLKALEAFLFKCIFETSGINSSFEVVAKRYLNQVSSDGEIGPIFRIITNINDELRATNISFNDRRLVRILLLESCIRNKSGDNYNEIR